MKATLYLICFWSAIIVSAQKADSLQRILEKTSADSTKTILLSLLADEFTKSDPSRAIASAKRGAQLASRIHFEKGVFENYFSLAAAFQGQALFDSAIYYYHKANLSAVINSDKNGQAEIFSGLGHSFMRKFRMDSARYYLDKGLNLAIEIRNYKVEAGIYNNYGNVFLDESNFQKALDYFIMAAKLYENPLRDDYGQCLTLSNIGNIQYRLGNYDQALDYANQSMAIAKRKKFVSSIGYAHKLLGRIYRKQQKFDEALKEYNEGKNVYLTLNDIRSVSELLQNIGNIYFDKEQHREALANYIPALSLAKRSGNKLLVATDYSCIGQAYLVLKKYESALVYLDSSRILGEEIGNKYLLMDNYEAMSQIYESKGDYKKALAVHRQFVQVKDSIIQTENRQLAEEAQAKYELEKKEAQISLLEKDKELKNLALERHQAVQAGTAVTLVLILIIAILLIHRYRVSNRLKRQAEIERVRNTLARDLHDDIGSTLSTINIISNLAMHEGQNKNSQHLKHIAEQSARMMENMADMVWSINPVNDSMEKILVKMKTFAGEILEPKNINYRFIGEDLLNGMTIDAEKRKNLFLIYKETLNNTAKYSHASDVEIKLNQLQGKFFMSISDNGHGFDEQSVKSGNGLKNMAARANAMGALFKLKTASGQGTYVELELDIT